MKRYKSSVKKELHWGGQAEHFSISSAAHIFSRLTGAFSTERWQLFLTAFLALAFVQLYSVSPVYITALVLILIVSIPLFLKKIEYGTFLLVALLPFRDIHLISVIHLKRFIIWGLFFYIIIRKFPSRQRLESSRPLSTFTGSLVIFVLLLILSLARTASELYTVAGFTHDVFKSMVVSNALVVIEEFLIFYIVYYSIINMRQLQRLLDVIIGISAIISVLGIVQYYTGGIPPLLGFLFDPAYKFYGRATSVFSNPNTLGEFLGSIIAITIVFLGWGTASRKKKLCFLLPVVILDCWAIYVSSSRSAMLQVVFSLLVIGYLYHTKLCRGKLSLKLILLFLILAALAYSAVHYYEFYLQARLKSSSMRDYQYKLQWIQTRSDFARKQSALMALQEFIKHPVLGAGYGMFAVNSASRFESFGMAAHNQYLTVLAGMGLSGILPLLIMFGIVIRQGLRFWAHSPDEPIPQGTQVTMLSLLTAISTILFAYLFADALSTYSITGYFWAYSGAIFVLERISHDVTCEA